MEARWNLEGNAAFLASERWVAGRGWRHMGIGCDQQIPETAHDGPRLWFADTW